MPVFADHPVKPDRRTKITVNPNGPSSGGPTHHSGLTGRKIAIDTYGEFARHSGKALSGKDPLRIDLELPWEQTDRVEKLRSE